MGTPAQAPTQTASPAFDQMPAGTKVKVKIQEHITVFAELDGYENSADGKMRIRCKGEEGRVFLLFPEHISLDTVG